MGAQRRPGRYLDRAEQRLGDGVAVHLLRWPGDQVPGIGAEHRPRGAEHGLGGWFALQDIQHAGVLPALTGAQDAERHDRLYAFCWACTNHAAASMSALPPGDRWRAM